MTWQHLIQSKGLGDVADLQYGADLESGGPLVLEDIEANPAEFV
jgi:hypothetical protein